MEGGGHEQESTNFVREMSRHKECSSWRKLKMGIFTSLSLFFGIISEETYEEIIVR